MLEIILPNGMTLDLVPFVIRDEEPVEWFCVLRFWFAGDAPVPLEMN